MIRAAPSAAAPAAAARDPTSNQTALLPEPSGAAGRTSGSRGSPATGRSVGATAGRSSLCRLAGGAACSSCAEAASSLLPAADDVARAWTVARVVSRGSTAPSGDVADRRDDTSATAGRFGATDCADARAVISRPPAEASTGASVDADGSAPWTGSDEIGAAATAATGCGLSAATGVTGGCMGTAGAAAG